MESSVAGNAVVRKIPKRIFFHGQIEGTLYILPRGNAVGFYFKNHSAGIQSVELVKPVDRGYRRNRNRSGYIQSQRIGKGIVKIINRLENHRKDARVGKCIRKRRCDIGFVFDSPDEIFDIVRSVVVGYAGTVDLNLGDETPGSALECFYFSEVRKILIGAAVIGRRNKTDGRNEFWNVVFIDAGRVFTAPAAE